MSVRSPVQIAKEIESIQALVRAGSLSEAAGRAAIDLLTGELLASATARATSTPSTPAPAGSPGTWAGRSGNGAQDELPAIGLDGDDEIDDATTGRPTVPVESPPPNAADSQQAAGAAGARKSSDELIRAEREHIEALHAPAPPVAATRDRGGVGVAPPTEAPGLVPAPAAAVPPQRGSALAVRLAVVAPVVGAAWVTGIMVVGFAEVVALGDGELAAFVELGWLYASALFALALVWRIARHEQFVPSQRVVGWTILVFFGAGCVGLANRLAANTLRPGAIGSVAPAVGDALTTEECSAAWWRVQGARHDAGEGLRDAERARWSPLWFGARLVAQYPLLSDPAVGSRLRRLVSADEPLRPNESVLRVAPAFFAECADYGGLAELSSSGAPHADAAAGRAAVQGDIWINNTMGRSGEQPLVAFFQAIEGCNVPLVRSGKTCAALLVDHDDSAADFADSGTCLRLGLAGKELGYSSDEFARFLCSHTEFFDAHRARALHTAAGAGLSRDAALRFVEVSVGLGDVR